MFENVDLKEKIGWRKSGGIRKGCMVLGLGSGSTVYWMLKKLGERVNEGLKIKGVPSSLKELKDGQ